MELRHLRYFCAVAEARSFSAAGRRLHISQSAISEQIADLEIEVGGDLFDRGQRQLRINGPGEVFLAEARKILQASERAVDLTQRAMRGEVGTLSVGFFIWGAGDFFARIVREYRKLYPGVRLLLNEMQTYEQMEALTAGKIDVGFARPLQAPFDRTLRAELLYEDPIVAALPRGHRLAGKTVELSDMAGEPFVLCDRVSSPVLYDSILALCSTAGFSPRVVNTAAVWSGVLTLVESGEGVALVPSGARHLRAQDVVFCSLLPKTTHVGLAVVWNPENAGPIQQDFLRVVRDNKDRIRRANT